MTNGGDARPTFTVFVPTYNRAHLLPRLMESVEAQTFQDFELLIVDDGSTDETQDYLQSYQPKGAYTLRVFRQENQGRHIAFNAAFEQACGLLFTTINSDDTMPPNALERFWYWWNYAQEHYPNERIVGVEALCADMDTHAVIGDRFPRSPMVSDRIEMHFVHRCRGDKVRAVRTDVISQYRFPQFHKEKYINPSYLWHQLGFYRHLLLFVNEALCYKEYREDGVTKNRFRTLSRSPRGMACYYEFFVQQSMQDGRIPLNEILLSFADWVRFALYTQSFSAVLRASRKFGLPEGTWFKGVLIGSRRRLRDLWRLRKRDC
ncbi:MAG: glycosyltransferase family 2 protein [Fimbriimonadales bacterium]|nr:MAG: glycosyl transferase [Fimbriimonadales bacterium]